MRMPNDGGRLTIGLSELADSVTGCHGMLPGATFLTCCDTSCRSDFASMGAAAVSRLRAAAASAKFSKLASPGRGLEKAFAGELVSFGAVLRLLLQEQRLLPSWAGGRTPRAPTATTTTATTHQVSFLPSWLTSAGVIACGGDCCCSLHGCRRCSARIRGSMRISHGRYSPPNYGIHFEIERI